MTCDSTAPNPWASTIGSFRENDWTVTLLDGAQIVVGDANAVALSSNATIVLGPNALIQNTPVTGSGLAGGGSETIVLKRGGSITLNAGARLIDAGPQPNASCIEVQGGGVRIDNSGLIQNELEGGLLLGDRSTLINRATGVITSLAGGNLFFGTTSLTLINFGMLHGDVGLDGGNNAVTIYTGSSISGAISLGTGDNTLTLAGAGSSVFANPTTGLVHLIKTDTGTWQFSAPQAVPQTIAIEAGTLLYRASVRAASVAVAPSGVFDAPAAVLPLVVANDGLVRVSADSCSVNYAGSMGGSGTFEKTGSGTLILSAAGANAGSGPTFVDAGTLAATQAGALSPASALVLSPAAGLALSASQRVASLFGAGTVTLDPSTLTTGAGNVDALFTGVISGDGSLVKTGSRALVLTGTNTFTGGTSIEAGELAVEGALGSGVAIAPGATLSGSGVIHGDVRNGGTISAGSHAFNVDVPTVSASGELGVALASVPAALGAMTISGGYASDGGALALRTVINAGGPGNQITDRLLVAGSVAGDTTVHVSPEHGTHAVLTGVAPTSGISIVQIGGQSAPANFTLPGGYVAAGPYRMRLVYFGPAQSADSELDPRLSALGTTQFNDYRLQTEQVLPAGTPPGDDPTGEPTGSGPDGEPPGAEVLIPQVLAYLALPTSALHYGGVMLDDLHKRAVELADPVFGDLEPYAPTGFLRWIGWTGNVDADASKTAEQNFHQRIWLVQAGGGVVWPGVFQPGDRLDTEVVISAGGSNSSVAINHAGTRFDATGLGVTATYRAVCGAYIDAIIEGLFFNDVGFSTDERGATGTTSGEGFVTSIESGMPFNVAGIVTIEPRVALTYQADHFKSFTDVDNVQVDVGDPSAFQARAGARISHAFEWPVMHADMVIEPFATLDYVRALDGHNLATIGGVVFADDGGGNALKYGGGVEVRVRDRLRAYLSFEHASGRGAPSATGNQILGTLRYVF
ncbi:MAG TPA: autotransporter outer membrane beta-barrel domain-containing protein [Pararobbsia sp.]|nr:autotransporter outer membrane beta-barrel domain-containing protein [Pararobbsia sp.]